MALPAAPTHAQELRRWTPVPGGFFLPQLLPGRYLVAVLESLEAMAYDREALEAIRERASAVTVKAGERSRVEVRVPAASAARAPR